MKRNLNVEWNYTNKPLPVCRFGLFVFNNICQFRLMLLSNMISWKYWRNRCSLKKIKTIIMSRLPQIDGFARSHKISSRQFEALGPLKCGSIHLWDVSCKMINNGLISFNLFLREVPQIWLNDHNNSAYNLQDKHRQTLELCLLDRKSCRVTDPSLVKGFLHRFLVSKHGH